MRPAAAGVARAAVCAAAAGYTYDELDCQALVEHCARQAGGRMDYRGSNHMARGAAWLGTLDEARAQGRLVPGAGLLIREPTEADLPARYRGDGLGDFSHVGLYVGENALTDTDKNGRKRACDVVHSSAAMGRVAGSTLQNGWTHAMWFAEIDYGEEGEAGAPMTPGAAADGTSGGTGGVTQPGGAPAQPGDSPGASTGNTSADGGNASTSTAPGGTATPGASTTPGAAADGGNASTSTAPGGTANPGASTSTAPGNASAPAALTPGTSAARYATVVTPDGGPVKLRRSASRAETLYWLVNAGARVQVERERGGWSLVRAICTDGRTRRAYLMSRYLGR